MKTLFQINVVANSGSTGHIAEELGRLVIASGWKSYIAYGRWACPSQSMLIRIGTRFVKFYLTIYLQLKYLLFGLCMIVGVSRDIVSIFRISGVRSGRQVVLHVPIYEIIPKL